MSFLTKVFKGGFEFAILIEKKISIVSTIWLEQYLFRVLVTILGILVNRSVNKELIVDVIAAPLVSLLT